MPINENLVQEIVQEVMAKMQIADAPTGKHGIFKDMNDAVAAAKKAQVVVRNMSMDQRERSSPVFAPRSTRARKCSPEWAWMRPVWAMSEIRSSNIIW